MPNNWVEFSLSSSYEAQSGADSFGDLPGCCWTRDDARAPTVWYRCCPSGCHPSADRLSPYLRRPDAWDCGAELDGSECTAFHSAKRHYPCQYRGIWLRNSHGRMGCVHWWCALDCETVSSHSFAFDCRLRRCMAKQQNGKDSSE